MTKKFAYLNLLASLLFLQSCSNNTDSLTIDLLPGCSLSGYLSAEPGANHTITVSNETDEEKQTYLIQIADATGNATDKVIGSHLAPVGETTYDAVVPAGSYAIACDQDIITNLPYEIGEVQKPSYNFKNFRQTLDQAHKSEDNETILASINFPLPIGDSGDSLSEEDTRSDLNSYLPPNMGTNGDMPRIIVNSEFSKRYNVPAETLVYVNKTRDFETDISTTYVYTIDEGQYKLVSKIILQE